jgi:hypothetical protein
MPLKPGSSKETVSQNISEFHTGKTYAHTAAKFGKERANKQAVAVALSTARKYAAGGIADESFVRKGSSIKLGREGMLNSSIPGRTDKIPTKVPAGSYILPADIPSALGQGNSMAGGQILKKMFNSGPYGLPAPKGGGRGTSGTMKKMFAEGGEADGEGEDVPIVAAGGEYIIPPDVVKDVGHGDMTHGHDVLDKFVLKVRKHNVKTLSKLPGPKR